ncbi:hypothetical protein HQQ81_13890 [Microbacteriaceae bacterium VKM Ac-2854]|nr:hypothetical protein [Microbacteriaceae bacterium VKM Ac-2854]
MQYSILLQELGGWSAQATATVIAAGVAAIAAIAGVVIGVVNSDRARVQADRIDRAADRRMREFESRDQWWTRFSWAMERAVEPDPQKYRLGLAVLSNLLDQRWVAKEDNEMAIRVKDLPARFEEGA